MTISEERVLKQLRSEGIRVYGTTIVSPFKMADPPAKDARINFMIEKCGYRLVDETGYPKRPEQVEEITA